MSGPGDDSRAQEEALQETESLSLRAGPGDAGARLDAFLAARIGERSRTRIKTLIEDGDVLVGGRAVKPSYRLRAGDRIEIELAPTPPASFIPENIPLEIIYEDEELVVVNKPAGMVVHPAAGVASGTLANALAYHFDRLPTSAGRARPGIIHRLDKETSGLIVVAKTETAQEALAEQFRARSIYKSYVALVHGRVPADAGKIEEPIGRDPRHRTRMSVVRGGRKALSLYRVRRRFERFTLLDVEIKTGRTHQIRVHLQWLRHPVVGDKVYSEGRDKGLQDGLLRKAIAALDRQFLHAEQLGLRHPRTGETMRFKAPLPADLQAFLELVGGREG
jgi:23S rRNA pseudouridine1911/1915/1917 synthase